MRWDNRGSITTRYCGVMLQILRLQTVCQSDCKSLPVGFFSLGGHINNCVALYLEQYYVYKQEY